MLRDLHQKPLKSPRLPHSFAAFFGQLAGDGQANAPRDMEIAKMLARLRSFARDDDGAVTVDWVVLTALIVGVQVILLLTPMRNALVSVAESVGAKAEEVGDYSN